MAWKPEWQQTGGKLTVAVVTNTFRSRRRIQTDYYLLTLAYPLAGSLSLLPFDSSLVA